MVEGGNLYGNDVLEPTNQVLVSELDAILTRVFPGAREAAPPPAPSAAPTMVGESAATQELASLIRRLAETGVRAALITGESGTGKELVARAIHANSARARGPFITVNMAAIPKDLIESELYGHEKGSFTGAVEKRPGKFELATGGTLFLDEIGEMPIELQAKLLRVLQEREIDRVGGTRPMPVDVRIVAATNADLARSVEEGRFRRDLYYRLAVVPIRLPPLREREGDVVLLARHYVAKYGEQLRGRPVSLAKDAEPLLLAHAWPGNVRELQNVLERLIWTTPGEVVRVADLPGNLRPGRIERVVQTRERRRQMADDLYKALTDGSLSFWEHVHVLFLERDLTRHDIRELVRRGLTVTHGNYRAVVGLFGMPSTDYKRFLNFLRKHDCQLSFKDYRQ